MQFGIILSAVAHAGLLVGVLLALASPRLFAALPAEPVMVDIVSAEEIAKAEAPETPERPEQRPRERTQSAADASAPAQPAAGAGPLQGAFSAFDPAGLVALYNMRLPGFDAPAEKPADLTADEVAGFKAHLRRCWRPPASLAAASGTRVVLRVFLSPDGGLQAEPMLIAASAAQDGPQVMQAAMHALQQCQPYAFLPRERYGEWKVLDISITPREMAGG